MFYGGGGEIRIPAPITRPIALAERPLQPLEYSSILLDGCFAVNKHYRRLGWVDFLVCSALHSPIVDWEFLSCLLRQDLSVNKPSAATEVLCPSMEPRQIRTDTTASLAAFYPFKLVTWTFFTTSVSTGAVYPAVFQVSAHYERLAANSIPRKHPTTAKVE